MHAPNRTLWPRDFGKQIVKTHHRALMQIKSTKEPLRCYFLLWKTSSNPKSSTLFSVQIVSVAHSNSHVQNTVTLQRRGSFWTCSRLHGAEKKTRVIR